MAHTRAFYLAATAVVTGYLYESTVNKWKYCRSCKCNKQQICLHKSQNNQFLNESAIPKWQNINAFVVKAQTTNDLHVCNDSTIEDDAKDVCNDSAIETKDEKDENDAEHTKTDENGGEPTKTDENGGEPTKTDENHKQDEGDGVNTKTDDNDEEKHRKTSQKSEKGGKNVQKDGKSGKKGGKNAKKDEKTAKKDKKTAKKDEKPVKKDEKPVKKDEETDTKDEEPAKQDEKTAKKDEETVKKDEETDIKDEKTDIKDEVSTKPDEKPSGGGEPEVEGSKILKVGCELQVCPDCRIPSRNMVTCGYDWVVYCDSRTRTPFWVVENITWCNVLQVQHRHSEAFRVSFKTPVGFRYGHPDNNKRLDVDHISIPAVRSVAEPQQVVCDCCEYSSFWPFFHQYVRFLTSFYENVQVCSGLLYLPTEETQDGSCKGLSEEELIPSHFFKAILCRNPDGFYRFECYKIPNEPIACDEWVNLEKYLVSRGDLETDTGFSIFPHVPVYYMKQANTHPGFTPYV